MAFERTFGVAPTIRTSAHGRVNLIGEHTDYNNGFVLPMPIPAKTCAELAIRADEQVRCASRQKGGSIITFEIGQETHAKHWVDYIRGITYVLNQHHLPIKGFDLEVHSDVPVGSGLSSSAALGIAVLRALREAFDLPLDDVKLAVLWREVENKFIGAQVGIMDPMCCSLGKDGVGLFIDCQDNSYEYVRLPADAEFAVIHSGLSHQHASGDYNTRFGECQQACKELGISSLRELTSLSQLASLSPILLKRARHVFTENERVLASIEALKQNDMAALGTLLNQSHASQRDDYQVSIPAIDKLVDIAQADPNVLGARLTGGGFGGSIVVLCKKGTSAIAAKRITQSYREASKANPRILVPHVT